MAGTGPRGRGVAKSRSVRIRPIQLMTDSEATSIAMTMSTRTGGLQTGEVSESHSSQNKPFVPIPGFVGKKVVVGVGATSRIYDMCLPGEDPFTQRNSCTFQMGNMEEKVHKLKWYKMRFDDKYRTLKMQVEILQRYGVRHLVKDQERIPIIIEKAKSDHSKGPDLEKLISDQFGKKRQDLTPSQQDTARMAILEIIQRSVNDVRKFAATYSGEDGEEVSDIMDLITLQSRLDAKMKAELEFQKFKESDVHWKRQCCEIFRKNPAPRDEPEELPNNDEFKKLMMGPQYTPQTVTGPAKDKADEFKRILKLRVDQLIHMFPRGVEENVFWKRFCSCRGDDFKLIDYGLKSPSEATDFNSKLFHICGNVDIGGRSTIVIPRRILLPACAKPKSTIDIIGDTYHQLKLIICERRDKAINLTNGKIYGIVKFMEEDWGMLGTETGVRIVLEVMESLHGENKLTILSNPTKKINFLCENSRRCIQKMEKQYGVGRKPEAKVLSVPQRSVLDVVRSPNSKCKGKSALPPMTSFLNCEYSDPVIPEAPIQAGETLKCKLKSNYGHDYFSLAIMDEKKIEMDSEKFFKNFREHEHYKTASRGPAGVDPTVYQVGMSVLAKIDRDGEYSRANVLTVLQEIKKYEVLFVDTGVRSEVPFGYVKALPHALMKSPAMTIICALRPGVFLKEASETGPLFQSIVNDAKEFTATFHGSHHDVEYKTKIWQVSLKIRLRPNGRWISVRDELQRQLAKKKNIAPKSDEDSDNSSDVFAYYANDEL